MEFPFEPKDMSHKHGGRITKITGIGHVCDKPMAGHSRDNWHFFGDVDWQDGSKSVGLEIAPWAVCSDHEHHAEVVELMELLNQYLHEHGKWYRHGKHKGWYADVRK